jgi:hypothetical protein
MLDRSTNFFDDDAPTSTAVAATAGAALDAPVAAVADPAVRAERCSSRGSAAAQPGAAAERVAVAGARPDSRGAEEDAPPGIDRDPDDASGRPRIPLANDARWGRPHRRRAAGRPPAAAARRAGRGPYPISAILLSRSGRGGIAAATAAAVAVVLVTIALAGVMGVGSRPGDPHGAARRAVLAGPGRPGRVGPPPTLRAPKPKRSGAPRIRRSRRHAPPARGRAQRLKRSARPSPVPSVSRERSSAVEHAATPRPASPVQGAGSARAPAHRATPDPRPTPRRTPRHTPSRPASEFGVEG